MSEGRAWLRCAVIGVAGLLGNQGGIAVLAAIPVGDILDRVFGHLDGLKRTGARSLCTCLADAMAAIAQGRDPGTVESARLATEDLLDRFGLDDAELTRLDLDPAAAADAVLVNATFSRDEDLELRPLCRELLTCFYRALPENPDLLAELLPHIHRATLGSLTKIQVQVQAILAKVSEQQGVPLAILQSILEGFGEQIATLDAYNIETRLRAKADAYRELTARLQRLTNADPRVQTLRGEAKALLDRGDFAAADARLAEARDLSLAAANEARQHYASLLETAAESEAERAQAAGLRSNHRTAAAHWAEAARIVAPLDNAVGWRYSFKEALALTDHGRDQGDFDSLRQSITRYRDLLSYTSRETRGSDWAKIQNSLGNSLAILGARETGTIRLEEAVVAYHAALEQRTRTRAPLDWAMTQSNLGNVLQVLGERVSGKDRLEEAVAAYRAALKEYDRKLLPLDWATIQNNLGGALHALGKRETGTVRLKEAAAAYRAALEERTRELVPIFWATTQNGLGIVLIALGEREGNIAPFEEAIAACRSALEEFTRERTPLAWATAYNSLGDALAALGELERSTARLEEAVIAYHTASQERTRSRVPMDWAATQNSLGVVLETLADHKRDPALLGDALLAMCAAAEVYRESGASHWLSVTEANIARVEGKIVYPSSITGKSVDGCP